MSRRLRAALVLGAALALAGCADERQPCALYDCGGACVDVRVDAAHCGACGHGCAEGQVCSGGSCALECEAPLAACETDAGLACVAIRTDAASCGACGVACPAGQVCAGGECSPECAPPLTPCGVGEGAWCADLERDRLDCGACANACAPGWACAGGACVESCGTEARCDGACVDLWTDARHCGACGNACEVGARCASAVCRDACALDGLARCGEGCADLASDAANCGACGRACAAGGLCVAGTCVAPACASGPSLPGPPELLDAVEAKTLLAADVDGDGLPDLLLSEYAGDWIVLYRGLAGGGFSAGEDAIPVAGSPAGAADVDGDGDRDVLVVRDGGVTLYENDGAGRFSAGRSYEVYGAAHALAADLDGDGRLDVVTAAHLVLHVWLAGATGPAVAYFVENVAALRAADVDGDGAVDLVAGAYGGPGTMLVLRNQGDGTFADPVTIDARAHADDLEVADLDGDGDPDAVFMGQQVSSPYDQVLGVLRNDGGSFVPAATHLLPRTSHRYDLLVADLDGDGRPDGAIGELDVYRVFRNLGDGTFAPPVLAVSGGAQSIAALDADHDGRVDLVATGATMAAIETRRQLPDGAWAGPEILPVSAWSALLADLDGDGRDDLVTIVPASAYDGRPLGTLELRLSGATGFGPPTSASGLGWTGALAGDLDRDGAIDLVVFRSDGTPGVLRNRGGGDLEDEVPVVGMGDGVLADVTGDGVLDVVGVRAWYFDVLRVARGYGNGAFAPPVATPLSNGYSYGFAVADVDGDGLADAAFLDSDYSGPGLVRVHPGRPDGTFGPPWERPIDLGTATGVSAKGLAAGDLDGDGRADLAALFRWSLPDRSAYVEAVAVMRGGAAGPGLPELHLVHGWAHTVAIGDLSGGGRRDVVVLDDYSLGVLATGEGGVLRPQVRWTVPLARGAPALGDLDGDLRGDVVVPAGDRVLVYRGACPAP